MNALPPVLLCLLAAACAPWPPEAVLLDTQAVGQLAPPLLPQELLTIPEGAALAASAAGDALAARAAALRSGTAGL